MLKLTNVTKEYRIGDRRIKALDNVSINFRENEFAAVLGNSGSGKTTLLNIIGGLDKYSSGDLIIYDKSTKKYKDKDWDNYRNKKIGFVFQSYNLIPHLNVLENVELALTISGISMHERRLKAIESLEKVGLKDYLKNKPNQLSGGQMQRVAIARALVNQPDILLADEPTGALDSQTSLQIMELIKEISKDKLVIMVTHNSELAKKYASRIINLHDGRVSNDTMPYQGNVKPNTAEELKNNSSQVKGKAKEKTSMSFFTALSLSFRNLFTKKARTVMVSVASSIGIVGVCLVLALSNGLNNYIAKLQSDTMASSPISITQQVTDPQAFNAVTNVKEMEKFPTAKKVFVEQAIKMQDLIKKNDITQDYIEYLQTNIKDEWINDVMYKNSAELNMFTIAKGGVAYSKVVKPNSSNPFEAFMGGSGIWQQMPKDQFVLSQYDIIDGDPATDKTHALLVVDEYNTVNDDVLTLLGLRDINDTDKEIDFSQIVGHKYKVATNNQIYEKVDNSFKLKSVEDIEMGDLLTLEIKGVARLNKQTIGGTLKTGLAYMPSLSGWILQENYESEIVEFMRANPNINPLTGEDYVTSPLTNPVEQRQKDLDRLGGNLIANEINIYAKDLESKEEIKKVLNAYNVDKTIEEQILYIDLSEMVGVMLSSMVDTVTYVLVGFSAVSLIVSSIMIAILTYVSVIERTKEIGILRSIGARKKDITRVFNAETFILGGFAGIIGIGATYLLTFPINSLLNKLAGVKNIAWLSITTAVIMFVISIGLSVLAGFLPSKKAAKKDPVLALRTE